MLKEKDVVELYQRCATEIPLDVIRKLKESLKKENNPLARKILKTILENIALAKKENRAVCQDTGVPIFYVKRPAGIKEKEIVNIIESATKIATQNVPLRPNAVDSLSGKNIGNVPIIHFEEAQKLEIDLLLKGGGSENVSCIYSLPNPELKANRDIAGIKKCVLDAVFRAQGKGCPPYIVGVAVGATIEDVAFLSKKQLLKRLDYAGEFEHIEKDILEKINSLGIGPLGLGGKTTALSVKFVKTYRHPASFFVGISINCWALRRAHYE